MRPVDRAFREMRQRRPNLSGSDRKKANPAQASSSYGWKRGQGSKPSGGLRELRKTAREERGEVEKAVALSAPTSWIMPNPTKF